MNRSRKVFIVAKGYHDYSPASEWGEIVYLSNEVIFRHNITEMLRRFEPIISHHSDRMDYIAVTGLASMCSIACTLFGIKHGRLNLLIHNSQNNTYMPREVILPTNQEYKEYKHG